MKNLSFVIILIRGRLHGRVVPAKRVDSFCELTRFLLLFPIVSTLRLHGKRAASLRRDPG